MAIGSAHELWTLVDLAADVGYLSAADADRARKDLDRLIVKMHRFREAARTQTP